jgi:hypothetical protein
VARDWRRLHNEELVTCKLHEIRVIKSRRMKWAEHVARMGEIINAYNILVGKPEGKTQLEDLGVDGYTILEWVLGKQSGKMWTGCIWLMTGTSRGALLTR